MKIEEIKKIVTHEDTRKYRVKLLNGKTKIVRLWSYYGSPCIIGKGRKHYGHYLGSYYNETDEWVSIKEINSGDVDFKKRIIKRAKDAQKMLEASGLWGDIKKEIDDFLNLPDEKIEEFVNDATSDFYENIYVKLYEPDNKYPWLHSYQIFESFLRNRCWKSPNFGRFNQTEKNLLKEKYENKENIRLKWRNGYDNSIEISFDRKDNISRGWYSEEYKDCGNGHYYLLFDLTHAIFYEDD